MKYSISHSSKQKQSLFRADALELCIARVCPHMLNNDLPSPKSSKWRVKIQILIRKINSAQAACVQDAAKVIISLIMHFWLSKPISIVVLSQILFIINHFATMHYFAENEKQNHFLSTEINSQETIVFQKGNSVN